MVASIFVLQGYDTPRRPERVAPLAEPVVRSLAERVPAVPAQTEQAGSPSIARRSRHAAKTARREASLVAKTAKASGQAGVKAGQVSSRIPG